MLAAAACSRSPSATLRCRRGVFFAPTIDAVPCAAIEDAASPRLGEIFPPRLPPRAYALRCRSRLQPPSFDGMSIRARRNYITWGLLRSDGLMGSSRAFSDRGRCSTASGALLAEKD